MARVTVEDCIDKVESPYELVLVAKERATQLNSGIEPTLERDNDKNTVIALREIAAGLMNQEILDEIEAKQKAEEEYEAAVESAERQASQPDRNNHLSD